jgi:C1A family cysteine protease
MKKFFINQKIFDLRDEYPYITACYNQEDCKTCWAISTISCFQDKIMIQSSYNLLNKKNQLDYNLFGSEIFGVDDICPYSAKLRQILSILVEIGCKCYTNNIFFRPNNITSLKSIDNVMKELYKGASLPCIINVYGEEYGKKSLYNYTNGEILGIGWWTQGLIPDKMLGYHAVRLIGWGEENGIKYWIIMNSWGKNFGDRGSFKVLRGVNCCGIEEDIYSIDNIEYSKDNLNYFDLIKNE